MALQEKQHTIKSLVKILAQLETKIENQQAEIDELKKTVFAKKTSIQKVATYNGETVPAPREKSNIEMDDEAKIMSVKNACLILPPNMKVNDRHTVENVSAICGFKVDEEMLEAAYGMIK